MAYKGKKIAMDHDRVIDRNYDLLLCDKTDYDEKVADIVSDYIKFVSKMRSLAGEAIDGIADTNRKKELQDKLQTILKTEAKSGHRNGDPRSYQDLVKGRFEINVKRIERISNIEKDISNKLFDYSADTIKQLIRDGYDDTIKAMNGHISIPPPSS
jgi:NTE family protein